MMKLVAVCATIFALNTVAIAKETSLRTKDYGVLGAMHRLGCKDDNWLPAVLRLSGSKGSILESELNSLPVGTRIVVPDECGTKAPAKADVLVTRKLMTREREYLAAKETQKELNRKLDETKVALDKAEQLSKNLERDSRIAMSRFKELERKTLEGKDRAKTWWDIDVFIGMLIFIFILVWRLIQEKKTHRDEYQKHHEELSGIETLNENQGIEISQLKALMGKKEEDLSKLKALVSRHLGRDPVFSMEYHGKMYQFRDTTEHRAGCPVCSESRIKPTKENYKQHLDKHVHLRIVEISPEEARRLLALSA